MNDYKTKKRDAIYLIISGPVFFIIGLIGYVVFSGFENGSLSTVTASSIAINTYKILGKRGFLILFTILGIAASAWGISKYKKLKKEENK